MRPCTRNVGKKKNDTSYWCAAWHIWVTEKSGFSSSITVWSARVLAMIWFAHFLYHQRKKNQIRTPTQRKSGKRDKHYGYYLLHTQFSKKHPYLDNTFKIFFVKFSCSPQKNGHKPKSVYFTAQKPILLLINAGRALVLKLNFLLSKCALWTKFGLLSLKYVLIADYFTHRATPLLSG